MNARQVKHTAREWVESNVDSWPGLRAAHLVGGITTAPEDKPFPPYKDVDMHLIFEDGNPRLQQQGPFPNILEVEYKGLSIEAGIKPASEYASAEAVLANPEIAHHLTVNSSLYDPQGLLSGLQAQVRSEYARRKWVIARSAYERKGLDNVLGLMEMARNVYGATGEWQALGYSFTFTSALLSVVTLQAPTTGSGLSLRMRKILERQGRRDLYKSFLAVMGLDHLTREQVMRYLDAGAHAFDLAVQVIRTPRPFGHKLHPHLRPYFVESSKALIMNGNHREAMLWLLPFYIASIDTILTDGTDADKPWFAKRLENLLKEFDFATPEARAARIKRAIGLHGELSMLASDIVDSNPEIVD